MKINTLLLYAAVPVGLLAASCSSSRIATQNRIEHARQSMESSSGVFVVRKDGQVVHYQTLTLETGMFRAPHLLADGRIRIQPGDISAYQNHQHYAISQDQFSSGRKSYVAVETLPGFAVRLVKGKLNVYCKKFYNGRAAIDEFYVQSAHDGKIYAYSPDVLSTLIQGNDEAMGYFKQSQTKTELNKKILTTAAIFNHGLLASND